MTCEGCGKDGPYTWTDMHGERRCLNCGLTRGTPGYGKMGDEPTVYPEVVALVSDYYAATGKPCGLGRFLGPPREIVDAYRAFRAWCEAERSDVMAQLREKHGVAEGEAA